MGRPTRGFADLTALKTLPPASLKVSGRAAGSANGENTVHVVLENPSNRLAFFIRLKVSRGVGGEEVLPVLWEDNYFSLLPGEKREIEATYRSRDLQRAAPVVEVEGWNVARSSQAIQ